MYRISFRVLGILFLVILGITLRVLNLDADIPLIQNADDLGDEGYWFAPARDLLLLNKFDSGTNFFQAIAGAPLTVYSLYLIGKLSGELTLFNVRALSAFYSSLTLLAATYYFLRLRKDWIACCVFLVLYGLFPVTLFYSRILHIEQHVLFYLFISFIILECAANPKYNMLKGISNGGMYILAGFVVSISILIKSVSLLVFPAYLIYLLVREKRNLKVIGYFALGALPIIIAYGLYIFLQYDEFYPTIRALSSYHRKGGFFIDSFSISYFWTHPLVRDYLPWLLAGFVALLIPSVRSTLKSWSFIWICVALIVLSISRYQSYARHHMLFFPLLIFISLNLGKAINSLQNVKVRRLSSLMLLTGLGLSLYFSTYTLGHKLFTSPTYTFREAIAQLGLITDKNDVVTGVHTHALSLKTQYKTRMNVKSPFWSEIDPIEDTNPSIALIASTYNNVKRTPKQFPGHQDFPFYQKLDTLSYLDRFSVDVYKTFWSEEELSEFKRFRQGRSSRYDGLLYNLFKDNVNQGCMLKALQVAESRGDKEISHLKVSRTGCAGMFGFCYRTAGDPMFEDIFKKIYRAHNINDDRFNPRKSMLAAQRYILALRSRVEQYTDKYKLTFASYNGGPGFISYLIKRTGKEDPRWGKDILPLLMSDDTDDFLLYGKWSKKERDHKLRVEVPLYVQDTYGTYQACLK